MNYSFQVAVLCFVTPCSYIVGYHLQGGSKLLRNFGTLPKHYTASQNRRHRLEPSTTEKLMSRIFHKCVLVFLYCAVLWRY